MQREQMWRAEVTQVQFTPAGQLPAGSPSSPTPTPPPTCREITLSGVQDQKRFPVHFIQPQAARQERPWSQLWRVWLGESGVRTAFSEIILLGQKEVSTPREAEAGTVQTGRVFRCAKALHFQGGSKNRPHAYSFEKQNKTTHYLNKT